MSALVGYARVSTLEQSPALQLDALHEVGMFGALAEFERELSRERTVAGLAAARSRGRRPGRRPVLTEDKRDAARRLLTDPQVSVTAAARALGVSRATLYRHLDQVSASR